MRRHGTTAKQATNNFRGVKAASSPRCYIRASWPPFCTHWEWLSLRLCRCRNWPALELLSLAGR